MFTFFKTLAVIGVFLVTLGGSSPISDYDRCLDRCLQYHPSMSAPLYFKAPDSRSFRSPFPTDNFVEDRTLSNSPADVLKIRTPSPTDELTEDVTPSVSPDEFFKSGFEAPFPTDDAM